MDSMSARNCVPGTGQRWDPRPAAPAQYHAAVTRSQIRPSGLRQAFRPCASYEMWLESMWGMTLLGLEQSEARAICTLPSTPTACKHRILSI